MKKESIHTMSRTELGEEYDSDHAVCDVFFATVEEIVVPTKIIDDTNVGDLNVDELAKIFGKNNSQISRSLIIFDVQLTGYGF